MNEKEKDDLLKDVVAAIGVIKAQYDCEVIKNYEIPPLVNMNTGETTGFCVQMQLNTSYDYDEEIITSWKRLLKADDWYINVKRNQLHIIFKVRYKKPVKQWKPSEDQMKALTEALSLAKNCGEESAFDLRTLHEQLKKLREE